MDVQQAPRRTDQMIAFARQLLSVLGAVTVIACGTATEPGRGRNTESGTADIADKPGTACPGYAIPTNCPPFPTGGSSFISGVLLERSATGTRPKAAGYVWAWVQYSNGNGYSAGRVQADASGAYRFPNLPNALIVLQGGGGGYDQPCASVVLLDGPSATANVEVVSETEPIVDTDPAPPALIGVVYEETASGRQPVPGARVFFETLFEVVAATTMTDQLGRYSLCRLPTTTTFVTPVKDGYVTTPRSVSLSGVMEMDLEMKRQ